MGVGEQFFYIKINTISLYFCNPQKRTGGTPWHGHADPESGKRALLPILTPAQLRHLAERDRRHHSDPAKTIIHYRGRKFTVDGIVLSLRL